MALLARHSHATELRPLYFHHLKVPVKEDGNISPEKVADVHEVCTVY